MKRKLTPITQSTCATLGSMCVLAVYSVRKWYAPWRKTLVRECVHCGSRKEFRRISVSEVTTSGNAQWFPLVNGQTLVLKNANVPPTPHVNSTDSAPTPQSDGSERGPQ